MYFDLEDFEFEEFEENLEDAAGRSYEKSQFMAALVEENFDGIIGMANCSNFFLTGPAGSGKSYLAKCFAQTAKENDYDVYQIDCEDIMEEDDADKGWKGIFEKVLEKTDPEGDYDKKMFLYLENLDAVKDDRKSVRVIASSLKKINNVDCKCIIVSTDLTGTSIPTAILKQFAIIELDKPDEEARIEFFKSVLKITLEDEEKNIIFYPLATGTEETQKNAPQYDELSVLALYCAEKTEGLTFGQLQIVFNQLNRQLKTTLQRITDGDAGAIKAHVTNPQKAYLVTEEEFLEIIAKVRKGAKVLEQAENVEKSGGNTGAVSVVSQPQVVYAQPMVMPGMPMAGGYPMPGGYPMGTPTNGEDAKLEFVKQVADDENPMVKDLDRVYEMAQESIGTEKSDMEGFM